MNLLNLSDSDKIEAFNMIVKAYEKDGDMFQFGYVQEVLILFLETSESIQ